jgi:hypothetical protein
VQELGEVEEMDDDDDDVVDEEDEEDAPDGRKQAPRKSKHKRPRVVQVFPGGKAQFTAQMIPLDRYAWVTMLAQAREAWVKVRKQNTIERSVLTTRQERKVEIAKELAAMKVPEQVRFVIDHGLYDGFGVPGAAPAAPDTARKGNGIVRVTGRDEPTVTSFAAVYTADYHKKRRPATISRGSAFKASQSSDRSRMARNEGQTAGTRDA